MQLQASIIVLTIKSNLNQGQLLYIFKAIIYCVNKWRSDYKLINCINELIAQTWLFAKYSHIFACFWCCHCDFPPNIFVSKHSKTRFVVVSFPIFVYIHTTRKLSNEFFWIKNYSKIYFASETDPIYLQHMQTVS